MPPRIFRPLLAALFVSPLLSAEPSRQNMIEVHARFLYATAPQMADALRAAQLPATPAAPLSPAQFETVRTKLEQSGANFFSDPRTMLNNGLRAVVIAVREIKYPSEYKEEGGKSIPTAFETRNAGVTLEVEAVVNSDGSLYLAVTPEVTTFLGLVDYGSKKTARPDGEPALDALLKAPLNAGAQWQPIFATFKVNTAITIESGQTVLMGGAMKTGDIPAPRGLPGPALDQTVTSAEQVFVFVTARIVPKK